MKQLKRNLVWAMMMFLIFLGCVSGKALAANIPSDALTFNGHSYKRYDLSMTWEAAKSRCESMGGHLLTITSGKEQQFVQTFLKKGKKNFYWLGAIRDSEGEFSRWTTGERISYTHYDTQNSEPNNYLGSENVLVIYRLANPKGGSSGALKWNDLRDDGYCNGEAFFGTENSGFICEWESVPKISIAKTSITISPVKAVYSGRDKKPSVKVKYKNKTLKKGKDYSLSYSNNRSTGIATVKISGLGNYTGSVTRTFSIIPAKVTGLSLKSNKQGQISASWKKAGGAVTGYQVQCSKSKKFSLSYSQLVQNGASTTFSGLTDNTVYYVRTRAYKYANGIYLYGSWSSTKKCKVAGTTIKLNKTAVTIQTPVSKNAKLTATVTGSKANSTVKWKSSNTKIVTVKNGKLTATGKAGTATITATVNKVNATCEVTVQDWAYKTVNLSFNSLSDWQKKIKSAESGMFPYTAAFRDPVSGTLLSDQRIIKERKILEYKTITQTYSLQGSKKTVQLSCPSKIQYKVYLHVHKFEKGFGKGWYIGDGGCVLVNQCSCGYRSEWTWEIPDVTEMENTQTGASIIRSLPQINKK